MIITFMTGEAGEDYKKIDVMVRPEQKIEDVYGQLILNGFLPQQHEKKQLPVFSLRRKEYVKPSLTFWQGRIYAGDILILGDITKFRQ
ncbi:MAG: hypothetical protein HFG82_05200 [Dorea sp.]|jgi:hypothetical protein|nr:hypothetical protein [Dorea sp.]GFI42880.1 hypothetical protein IMSAGC018_00544 [Lachnospiraceae bacterium]